MLSWYRTTRLCRLYYVKVPGVRLDYDVILSAFLRLENGGLVAVGGAHKVRGGYSRFAYTLLLLSPDRNLHLVAVLKQNHYPSGTKIQII